MNKIRKLVKSSEPTTVNIGIDPNVNGSNQRIVVGFATLDNVDKSQDIVTAEASMKAFSRFRGNVRYMHERMPVGKVIHYEPAVFRDSESGREYNGIQVTVKISEAEDDVWIKCQDGTLSGFSIGGEVLKVSHSYDDRLGNIKVIEDYELTELSIVDSPANQFANITAIRKSADGSVQEGDSLEMHGAIEKVFEITTKGGDPSMSSKNKVEKDAVSDNGDSVENSVEETQPDVESVNPVAEEAQEDQDSSGEDQIDVEATDVTSAETVSDDSEEKEVIDLQSAMKEILDRFKEVLDKESSEKEESLKATIKNIDEKLAGAIDVVEKLQKENDELASKVKDSTLDEKIDAITKSIQTLGERLEGVVNSTAVRKSVDSEDALKDQEDGPFKGLFSF